MWRLFTATFLQDSGLRGTVFKLVILAVTIVLVRGLITGPQMIGLFVAGGVVCNIATVATFGQSGAGNSMARIFLAASTLMIGWVSDKDWVVSVTAVAVVVGAAIMLAARNQHGLAAASGLVVGVACGLLVSQRATRH